MSIKTEVLFNNTWNVRISDPGEEGAQSHFFETIYLTLTAYFEGENVRYEFVRKVEDQVKIKRSFTELGELFKFLGDYLDPVSLGNLGVKIGNLSRINRFPIKKCSQIEPHFLFLNFYYCASNTLNAEYKD